MPWIKKADGSIETQAGKVIFFSPERFRRDIWLGDCCFICGSGREAKPFNDEHVIPDWILRRFNLFRKRIQIPNGAKIRYDKYKIPCCLDCNAFMGEMVETPISEIVNAGANSVQDYLVKHGPLKIFVWLALVLLKSHLKDRYLRFYLDERISDEKIADMYDWRHLFHLHCVARCFYNESVIAKEVFGSLAVIAIQVDDREEDFDFADLYAAQTVMMRLGRVGLIGVFNDSCGAINGFMPRFERIDGPLSTLQFKEMMTDFAFLNLSIKNRPKYISKIDLDNEQIALIAEIPKRFRLVKRLNYPLRGALMRRSLADVLPKLKTNDMSPEEFEAALTSGHLTFLFDKEGKFIRKGLKLVDL